MKPRQEERHAWEMLVVVGTFVKVQDSVGNVQLRSASRTRMYRDPEDTAVGGVVNTLGEPGELVRASSRRSVHTRSAAGSQCA